MKKKSILAVKNPITHLTLNCLFFPAPKPVGRRARKPGIDRKPRQAYSAKQLDRLESEFKVKIILELVLFKFRNQILVKKIT